MTTLAPYVVAGKGIRTSSSGITAVIARMPELDSQNTLLCEKQHILESRCYQH